MGYLSDVARRRIAALLLLAGIVVAVFAATDTGPLFDNPPTEEARVQETVEMFFGAAAEGDFEGYCALLTETARNLVRASAARLVQEGGRLSCAEILSIGEEAFAGATVRIREVSVSGNRARVEANLKRPGTPGVEPRTLILEQEQLGGEWRFADAG